MLARFDAAWLWQARGIAYGMALAVYTRHDEHDDRDEAVHVGQHPGEGDLVSAPGCAYCSDLAVGVDGDGEYTCGADTCIPCIGPLPRVIECEDEDEDVEEQA